MKKMTLILPLFMSLAACSTTPVPQAEEQNYKKSIVQDEDYPTGSNIPHHKSAQPVSRLDQQQAIDLQRQFAGQNVTFGNQK